MLGIEINGEFLDLLPGANLELQKENPFLQFNEKLIGEYSLPFQAPATPKNLRLLNYAAIIEKQTSNTGIDALLYDAAIQVGAGKVKIERASININKTSKGTISCYYLSAASGFWQDIKDIKLRDINTGGDISYPWASGGPGSFWEHIFNVVNGAVGDYNYAFFPVINMKWPSSVGVTSGEYYPPVMNRVYADGSNVRFYEQAMDLQVERNRIIPFPYLKHILVKTFEHVGWSAQGDILDDPDFIKITMLNFRAIDWAYVETGGPVIYRDPVIFNLKDHLPDITISSFLIALMNRFGFWYDFDSATRKVTIRMLNDLTIGAVKNMTDKSSPLANKNIVQQRNIYAFRNRFVTDIADGAPNFKTIDYIGDVDKTTDLPTANSSRYGHVYLVREENNFYNCAQNPDDDIWQWWPYAYNIYDHEPDGANTDIFTDATTVGQERLDSYFDLIPRIDNTGEWLGRTDTEPSAWGIHLAFYFGKRNNKSGDPVPYASHHLYDSQGYTLAAWSIAFRGQKTITADQVGLYDLNWKPFIDMISGAEEIEHTLYLPMHEYLQLKFSDRVNVAGVNLFIKQIKSSIPYKGSVQCTSIRV